MKSLSLLLLSLIATQAYANLLDGLEHTHGHGDHGHDHAHDHHGEHGDHGHGEHGDHGHEHADHGEHDEHGEHGDHGDHGAHGDHGDHGAHGDHAEGHHDHAEGDHQQHDAQNTVNNDAFANTLASDLGGGFLSSNPVPSNDFGAQPSNDLSQGFLQANPGLTQAPVQAPRQNTQTASSSNQGKQLLDDGELGGPKYNTVPQTSFRCEDQATGGYFADTEADCQVFHICLNGDNLGSFLCPNGTLFHQQYFVCDWWFNVDCNVAPDSYNLNAAIGVVPEEIK